MAAGPRKKSNGPYPKHSEERKRLEQFLCEFRVSRNGELVNPYFDQLQSVANRTSFFVDISLDDIANFFNSNELAFNIARNTRTYQLMLYKIIDFLLPPRELATKELAPKEKDSESDEDDEWKWQQDRLDVMVNSIQVKGADMHLGVVDLSHLNRRYQIRFLPIKGSKLLPLRLLRSAQIGSLVGCSGVVARVSDVQPLMKIAGYSCLACGDVMHQPVDGKTFEPLKKCISDHCRRNDNKTPPELSSRYSRFQKFQEILLQEQPHEVPMGHIPRSLVVHAFDEMTRTCKPGELVSVSGIFLPQRPSNSKTNRSSLTTNTYLELMGLSGVKGVEDSLTETETKTLEQLCESKENIYDRLAYSIAPEIYAASDSTLMDAKKALLLALVGGAPVQQADLRIRGDIHVMLMGDPGVAKSQLLKHMTKIAPRAIYTTGAGSSGVGLTASVRRDEGSKEMVLEGGALVMSDNGICCIDEFDKMKENDRTAIHEIMEQQTVSIAKAGIVTTLNARASVIAAANPLFGRWNPSYSTYRNLGLPVALLSRFDLSFVLRDEPNEEKDEALAQHICSVHMNSAPPKIKGTQYDFVEPKVMRHFIAKARQIRPHIPPKLTDMIVGTYVELRKETNGDEKDFKSKKSGSRKQFVTPRALLSMMRLCQALARVNLREEVNQSDVIEAERLMWKATRSADSFADATSAQAAAAKSLQKSTERNTVEISRVVNYLTLRNQTPSASDVQKCVDEYSVIGLWIVRTNANGTPHAVEFIDEDFSDDPLGAPL